MKVQLFLVVALLAVTLVQAQYFVKLGGDAGKEGSDVDAFGKDGKGDDLETRWKTFVKWFRENGGIISSKLTLKERNNRQGVYFKERMRRGETLVSFPRTLRLDEKTALKSQVGPTFRELKEADIFPDLRLLLYVAHERANPKSFWKPYLDVLPRKYNNIMYLTDAELRKLLRRPGCENTHNLGVQMRRTFLNFFRQYGQLISGKYKELEFSRDQLLWAFCVLVVNGWESGPNQGMLVPFSDVPAHRRESAQKATNRGFISAAKEYQSGEELTFDYGLLNDAVLAYYGTPTPDCRGLKR